MKTYKGSCHCGAVRFEAALDLGKPVGRCNCTMCTKSAAAVASTKPAAFQLLAGEKDLVDYKREGGIGSFPFCRTCGIHAFSTGDLPELGGAFVAINVNCLDDVDPARLEYVYWDGRHENWGAGPRPQPWPL